MIFSLAIYATPSSESSLSALQFAKAVVSQGHSLYRIFFYHEGVQHGSMLAQTPQDEFDLTHAWGELKQRANCELCICIAAGVKRGIFTQDEAKRYEQEVVSIDKHFTLVGLGDLVEATEQSDRILSFGVS